MLVTENKLDFHKWCHSLSDFKRTFQTNLAAHEVVSYTKNYYISSQKVLIER